MWDLELKGLSYRVWSLSSTYFTVIVTFLFLQLQRDCFYASLIAVPLSVLCRFLLRRLHCLTQSSQSLNIQFEKA